MDALDELLERLALEAQRQPPKSKERRRILLELHNAIRKSNRLQSVYQGLRNNYTGHLGSQLFEECYADALAKTWLEILEKIDNYNPGEAHVLFKAWQEFCNAVNSTPLRESDNLHQICQTFCEKVELFRQQVDAQLSQRKDYTPESSHDLFQICQELCNDILNKVLVGEASLLQSSWSRFCDRIKQYDSKKKVLTWVKFLLDKRFIDEKNERLNLKKTTISGQKIIIITQSLDNPIKNRKSKEIEESETYGDNIQQPTQEPSLAQDLIQIIKEDSEGLFISRHLRNCSDTNYRALALKRAEEKSWEEIAELFGKKIGTITPFFTRSHNYFRPLLKELLLGEFYLSKDMVKIITEDRENLFKEKHIQTYQNANFQYIMLKKIEGASWKRVAAEFENKIPIKDIIEFFLDTISYLDTEKSGNLFSGEFRL